MALFCFLTRRRYDEHGGKEKESNILQQIYIIMEIEKIVSTVREKVGNTDFSAQTIQKYVELNPVADGQEPDEAYFTKAVDFVKAMQGQYNHDFSTKFAEAKKNLLTEDTFKNLSAEQIAEVKKLIEGLKPAGKGPEISPQESEEVKALKAEIAKLTERLDNGDKAKQQAELLQKVKAAMKEQKASDDYVLDNTLRGVELDVTKSVEDLTKEYLAKYDAEYLKCRGAGAPPRLSSGGGSGEETALKARFKKKAQKEGWGKKN